MVIESTSSLQQNSATWIGVNFWSRSGGPLMWQNYDAKSIRMELKQLADSGCNVTRSFLYWPHFVPEEHFLDENVLNRFSNFLDAHLETGLSTVPTFIVGHMSGENWDPSWRNGRDIYRDTTMVAEQSWFAYEIADRFSQHPAICGWLISNEIPLYGGKDASQKEIYAWAQSLIYALKAAGARQPVSLGDGAWGLEMTGNENGFSLRTLQNLLDFIGPHVYPMQDDEITQFLYAAYTCSMAAGFELPVIMEEFGVTSDFASDKNASIYYRHLLYSTLLAGAKGWIAWNNCDYDHLYSVNPYRHHPFELHFGLVDSNGKPKQQLNEISSFSKFIKGLKGEFKPSKSNVAIVVPEHFETIFPFMEQSFRSDTAKHMLQAYVSSRLADLNIEMTREKDGFPGEHRLYLLPSTKILTTTGVKHLTERLKVGANLYLSYFGGSTDNQRGPWIPWLEEVFGVKHKLKYGLTETITTEVVKFQFQETLGDIKVGETLEFRAIGTRSSLSYLPVETDKGARVIAVDQNGLPAIVSYSKSQGTAFLCTYPIEHFAANTSNINRNGISKIYRAIAAETRVLPKLYTDDARVSIGTIENTEDIIAIVANFTQEHIIANVFCNSNYVIKSFVEGNVFEKITLLPYEVSLFRLVKSDKLV